jgi:ribonuclease HII
MLAFERDFQQQGYTHVAGIDEAGRGPLAGPVVAAACLLPTGWMLPQVNDSKQLSPQLRKRLYEQILEDERVLFGVGVVHAAEIDRINIYQATIAAMLQAVSALCQQPDFLLVDGMPLKHPTIPSLKIIRGDQRSLSIAAASIIAKETRDELMREYHQLWPDYGFGQHMGYGTPQHLAALELKGPCPIHRMTFAPVKHMACSNANSDLQEESLC